MDDNLRVNGGGRGAAQTKGCCLISSHKRLFGDTNRLGDLTAALSELVLILETYQDLATCP